MLRSELKIPRTEWSPRAIIGLSFFTTGVVVMLAAMLGHLWQDDHRADKLRELEKAHAVPVAPVFEPKLSALITADSSHVDNILTVNNYPDDLFVPPTRTDHDLMIMNPDTNKNVIIDGVVRYARDRKPNRQRGAHALSNVDTEITIDHEINNSGLHENPVRDASFCATKCVKGGDCYALVIYDRDNHVELDLPCVDGHVGTWVMTKLP